MHSLARFVRTAAVMSGLALATGAHVLTIAAVTLYAGLLIAWAVVGTRTARGAWHGQLLRSPSSAPATP